MVAPPHGGLSPWIVFEITNKGPTIITPPMQEQKNRQYSHLMLMDSACQDSDIFPRYGFQIQSILYVNPLKPLHKIALTLARFVLANIGSDL
jgi:hypothetical protein